MVLVIQVRGPDNGRTCQPFFKEGQNYHGVLLEISMRYVVEMKEKGPWEVAQWNKITGFDNFITSNELIDLPLIGRKYTWYKPDGVV